MRQSRLNRIRNWEELASKAQYKLNHLADLAATCPRHLRRYIETKKGKTPRAWMLELRLGQVEPLREDGKSMKEIASIAKFKQPSHFSRVYKKWKAAFSTLHAALLLVRTQKSPVKIGRWTGGRLKYRSNTL